MPVNNCKSAQEFCEILEAHVYRTEYDAQMKAAVRNRKVPDDFFNQQSQKLLLDSLFGKRKEEQDVAKAEKEAAQKTSGVQMGNATTTATTGQTSTTKNEEPGSEEDPINRKQTYWKAFVSRMTRSNIQLFKEPNSESAVKTICEQSHIHDVHGVQDQTLFGIVADVKLSGEAIN